jgi:ABC-type methionine transport system ATPase subunit
MQETIKKQLAGKTRLIITHAMHFLKYADKVYYVDKGRIIFKGTYEMIKKEDFFQHYLTEKEAKEAKEQEKKKETQPVSVKVEAPKPVDEIRKIETKVQENPLLRMFASEDKDAGGLGFGVIHTFIVNTGGYFCFLIYVILSAAGAYYKILSLNSRYSEKIFLILSDFSSYFFSHN